VPLFSISHSSSGKIPTMALTLSNTFLQKNVAPPAFSLKKMGIGSNQMRWSCRKKDIHPKFYDDAKVYCNGEHVMTTGGTKNEYTVDVWSGTSYFHTELIR
ncbi:hypothetical protein AABB24_029194, partial [Solanum stoloniferum]